MRRTSAPSPAGPARRSLALGALLLGAALAMTSGCATFSAPPPNSGGDGLTTAARETRKKPQDQKPLAAAPQDQPRDSGPYVSVGYDDDPPTCTEGDMVMEPSGPPRRPLEGLQLGAVAGITALGRSPLGPAVEYGLGIGMRPTRFSSVDLDLVVSPERFAASSPLAGAFDGPLEAAVDLSVRHAITRDGRPLPIVPLAGFRVGSDFWSYHNGVILDDGNGLRTVTDDDLTFYQPYVGMAATLADSPRGRVGLAFKTGMRFHDATTTEGLRNDAFPSTGFVQIQLETRLPF